MPKHLDVVSPVGTVFYTIDYLDGLQVKGSFKNTVLRTGKIALAKLLAHQEDDPFSFYIDQMVFGTNGAVASTPKFVEETRTGLFGATLLSKNVIASIDSSAPTSVILSSVITYSEGNGNTLNEMALVMGNEEFYSMVTFPGIGKTSNMQLTWDWVISFM